MWDRFVDDGVCMACEVHGREKPCDEVLMLPG